MFTEGKHLWYIVGILAIGFVGRTYNLAKHPKIGQSL